MIAAPIQLQAKLLSVKHLERSAIKRLERLEQLELSLCFGRNDGFHNHVKLRDTTLEHQR